MTNKDNAIKRVDEDLLKFKQCQLYCHGYSRTPLNEMEKHEVLNKYREQGYRITQKSNSHNVTYYLIG